MLIYKVTNLINNKVYIGMTIRTLKHRKWRHIWDSKHHTYNSYFHAALRKYGEENFKWEIIQTAKNKDYLKQLEVQEISKYHSNDKRYGYNLTKGGESLYGKDNPFYGKTHSDKQKYKWSKERKGKNIGLDNYFYDKHFTGKSNHFYGKQHKQSTKDAIGNANSRKFRITSSDGNSFIIKNLSKYCINNSWNYKSLKGKLPKSYKGYYIEKL